MSTYGMFPWILFSQLLVAQYRNIPSTQSIPNKKTFTSWKYHYMEKLFLSHPDVLDMRCSVNFSPLKSHSTWCLAIDGFLVVESLNFSILVALIIVVEKTRGANRLCADFLMGIKQYSRGRLTSITDSPGSIRKIQRIGYFPTNWVYLIGDYIGSVSSSVW